MKTKLLSVLPLVWVAFVGLAQPREVGYLNGDHINSAVDVDGIFYYAEGHEVHRMDADHSYTDYLWSFEWGDQVTDLTSANGLLFFNVTTTDKTSLWRSDGTSEGTFSLIEFNDTFTTASPVIAADGAIFFGFRDKVYRSDGTPEGTVLMKDLHTDADRGFLRLQQGGAGFFINFRRAANDYELWQSDGTAAGTVLVNSFSYIEFLDNVGTTVYFVGDDGSAGRELWSIDVNESTTIDLNPGGGSSFAVGGNAFVVNDERIVFTTATPAAVWTATPSSTQQLAPRRASEIVNAGGKFLFVAGNELWVTGGTPGHVTMVRSFATSGSTSQRLTNLRAYGNNASFVVDGIVLWQTDGTAAGTLPVWDHTPSGTSPSGAIDLFVSGDHLVYVGAFSSSDYPVWYASIYSYDTREVRITDAYLIDAETNQEIKKLENPTVINVGQHVSVRADATLATGRVIFSLNGAGFHTERERPFSLAGDGGGDYYEWEAMPGTYELRINPYSTSGSGGTVVTYQITVRESGGGCGTGTIAREFWRDIEGNDVASIPFDRRPAGMEMLTLFEAPSNWGTNYGARVKGYLCPPETGTYIFWISSNDQSELWLSTDDQPATKKRIAFVSAATNPRQWDKFAAQRSAPIQLQAGQRYYIEARHKQGGGTDHLAVGWQLPSGTMERPIPGNRLSPFTGNQPPEVRIVSPEDGQVFPAPVNIRIQPEIKDTDGFPVNIRFYAGNKLLRESTDSYFDWMNVPPGAYPLYVSVTDNSGATTTSDTVNIVVAGQSTASGEITYEQWNNVPGNKVSDIPLNEIPDTETSLTLFEAPMNSGTHYGARLRGYISPPSSGSFTFWISSNDHSELWLSSDEDPDNKVRIASVTGATNPRQWDKFASQRSAPVSLVSGKKYYIEALHKQGVGSDHLAVGWQLPDGTMERPIAGSRLSPFGDSEAPGSYVVLPVDGEQDVDPMVMRLKIAPVVGARRYRIELNTQADFTGPSKILESTDDYQLIYVARDLDHSTTYYARVRTDISGFGAVSRFTTRNPVGLHRLWGITTAGGDDGMGTIFSFSIDSGHFVKHYDKEIVRYVYGEGEDDYVEYEERLRGTPVAGPEGTWYGESDHDYVHNMFVMNQAGEVQWLDPFVFIYEGNIMLASDNCIYVTTSPYIEGGVIDKYPLHDPSMTQRLRVFNAKADGLNPSATLVELPDGYLYGTAREGGLHEGGVVYRIRHGGTDFKVVHHFQGFEGKNPYAGLAEAGGFLYGTTAYGGTGDNNGAVFKVRPDGTEFTTLYSFDGWNGRRPMGEVIVHDDVVYGMTTAGGASDKGIIYRVNSDGTGFAKLHEFSGVDGDRPSGKLALAPDGTLYGMTTRGGVNNYGVIFAIGSDGTNFAKLFDFSPSTGGLPEGSMVLREDMFGPPASAMARATSEINLSVSVHPNPSMDDFKILVSTPVPGPIYAELTDQYGQSVATYQISNGMPLAVGGDLKKGIYIMKVIQGREISMQRIVKK